MKFSICYIPPQGGFYDLGSHVLGYDIRQEKEVDVLNKFESEWTKLARKYGFHLTITDSVDIEQEKTHKIEKKVEQILNCFSKTNEYILKADKNNFIEFWNGNKEQAALMMLPNKNLLMLHCILVSLIQTEGSSSFYSNNLQIMMKKYKTDDVQKINLFYSPYIFDNFKPHFTLINPYLGKDQNIIKKNLCEVFNKIRIININILSLVVQKNPGDYYKIYREFNLNKTY